MSHHAGISGGAVIATMVMLIVVGSLTGLDSPGVSANLSTPWIGVWERIIIGVFLLWIVILAFVLLSGAARRGEHDAFAGEIRKSAAA